MRYVLNILLILFFSSSIFSQDKSEIAQIYFNRAQKSLQQKDVESTVKYLDKAQSNFGGITNSEFAVFGANFYFDINKQKKSQEFIKAFFTLNVDQTSATYERMLLLFTYNTDVLEDATKYESIKKRVDADRKAAQEKYYLLAKSSFESKEFLNTKNAIQEYFLLSPETNKEFKELETLLTNTELEIKKLEDAIVSDANTAFQANDFEKTIQIIDDFLNDTSNENSSIAPKLELLKEEATKALEIQKSRLDSIANLEDNTSNLDSISNQKELDTLAVEKPVAEIPINKDEIFSFLLIDEAPVFPNCESSNSLTKDCFSKNTLSLFDSNFDKSILSNLGLAKGTTKVLITFVVNTDGLVTDALVRAANPKISEESKRVLSNFPKMKPATLGGVVVNVKYSFPYVLTIE